MKSHKSQVAIRLRATMKIHYFSFQVIMSHAWNTTDFVQIWCACAAMYVE